MNVLGAQMETAASASNQFGLDLYRKVATGDENVCLSPYSIESALAMTFAGSEGATRTEMARVLHLPQSGDEIHGSFAALQKALETLTEKTKSIVEQSKKTGGPSEPIALTIANRLFAETGYNFRQKFLTLAKNDYRAPLEPLDFSRKPEPSRVHINEWVAERTHNRIRDLIPAGAIEAATRMVLTNALYLNAPWADPFEKESTKPELFHVKGSAAVDVPMMHKRLDGVGYAKHDGHVVFTIPYSGRELDLVVFLPDKANGLPGLEKKLRAEMLAESAKLPSTDINLSLPKFKLEPPTVPLREHLEKLGMATAFDQPQGSANFDRLAPRRPNEYLYLSSVFHKTFIAVDEEGTEAAAATAAVIFMATSAMRPREPIEVKVDRPFLYAIQHGPSGVCLFLGRVTDPR
jgi:serine protease inhibitor